MKKKESASLEVNWSKQALEQLDNALDYLIENGAAKYAFELYERIILKTDDLIYNHHIFPIDKYKTNNKGNYRAFEIDDYRISYRVTKSAIKIIRLRHTSRRTKKY